MVGELILNTWATLFIKCHSFKPKRDMHRSDTAIRQYPTQFMMTSWNGNIFRVTGPLWGTSAGHRWIPLTKASDAELWCFLWSSPEQTVEQTIETPWDSRRHRAHYDVTVMCYPLSLKTWMVLTVKLPHETYRCQWPHRVNFPQFHAEAAMWPCCTSSPWRLLKWQPERL